MQDMSEEIAQLKALLEREQQENKCIREANIILAEKNKKLIEALAGACDALCNAHYWFSVFRPDVKYIKNSLEVAEKALEENEK